MKLIDKNLIENLVLTLALLLTAGWDKLTC